LFEVGEAAAEDFRDAGGDAGVGQQEAVDIGAAHDADGDVFCRFHGRR
jgi:hypothetical protein